MLRRSTLTTLFIFVLLAIGVLIWHQYGRKDESVEPTPTTKVARLVFDLGLRRITSFTIQDSEDKLITFEKDSDTGAWTITDMAEEFADSAQIDTIASNFANLVVDTELTTQPALDAMGLEKPSHFITLGLDNGEKVTLFIGDLIPTGSGYYARVDDELPFVVLKSDIDNILYLLNTPPLVATNTATATVTPLVTVTWTPMQNVTSTIVPVIISESEKTNTPTP